MLGRLKKIVAVSLVAYLLRAENVPGPLPCRLRRFWHNWSGPRSWRRPLGLQPTCKGYGFYTRKIEHKGNVNHQVNPGGDGEKIL
jgi:hypothetical protein